MTVSLNNALFKNKTNNLNSVRYKSLIETYHWNLFWYRVLVRLYKPTVKIRPLKRSQVALKNSVTTLEFYLSRKLCIVLKARIPVLIRRFQKSWPRGPHLFLSWTHIFSVFKENPQKGHRKTELPHIQQLTPALEISEKYTLLIKLKQLPLFTIYTPMVICY